MTNDSTSERCPCCGQSLPVQPSTLELLRQWCAEHGKFVCASGAVDAAVAAEILARKEGTLMNWRAQGSGPTFYRHGSGRCRYRLTDIASWIDANRSNEVQ